jgi:hypothetical protein
VPRTIALSELRDGAFDLADELASGAIPIPTANRWVNQAYAKYYDILIKSGADYSVRQQVITTNLASDPAATTDTSVYLLPGDHYETRGLDANLGGQQYVTMHRLTWADRNRFKLWGTTGWFVGIPLAYLVIDKCLQFSPIPTSAYSVTHWYYPVAPIMAQDGQTVDVLSGGDLFIMTYAAALMTLRQESFELSDRLNNLAEAELARAKDMASDRDANEPPRVQEVCRRGNQFRRGWGI